jgi:transcriptional regulator with XRE-family HTH domain
MKNYNEELYKYRVLNRLSQNQMAKILGISQSLLSLIENDKIGINDELFKKYQKLTNSY